MNERTNEQTNERTDERMKTITIGLDTYLSIKMIPFSGLLDIVKKKRNKYSVARQAETFRGELLQEVSPVRFEWRREVQSTKFWSEHVTKIN